MDVAGRSLDPSPGYRGYALSPPQSEVPPPFSWGAWYPMRHTHCPTFLGASVCGIESDMWTMVRALVSPAHSVLELGARYGTTSCVLAQATNNSGRVVSVEPDPAAHDALQRNRAAHKCNFHIFRGTVGRTSQVLLARRTGGSSKTYEVRTRTATPDEMKAPAHPAGLRGIGSDGGGGSSLVVLDRLDVESLERRVGFRFNALVVDCEGCIGDVLSPALLSRQRSPPLQLLLVEMDVLRRVNYAEWHVRLSDAGFTRTWLVEDALFQARGPRHAAWHRAAPSKGPEREPLSCVGYAQQQQRAGWPRCALSTRKRTKSKRDADWSASLPRARGEFPSGEHWTFRCGSRLTCLNPLLVNGSHEHAWVQASRKTKMLATPTGPCHGAQPQARHARQLARGRALYSQHSFQ